MRVPDNYLAEGEIYNLTVTAVKERCLVVMIDGTEYTAIIHISNLSNRFITNISEFADVGTHLRAKAVKRNGNVELSVKDLESNQSDIQPKQYSRRPSQPTRSPQTHRQNPKRKQPQGSDLDRMIASCEASFKDKMRDRNIGGNALKRGRYTRTRHNFKNNGNSGDDR